MFLTFLMYHPKVLHCPGGNSSPLIRQERYDKLLDKVRDSWLNAQSWFWLIEMVKNNGQISDIICLIPKICHFELFEDIFEANHVTEFQQDYLILLKMVLKYGAELYRFSSRYLGYEKTIWIHLPDFLEKGRFMSTEQSKGSKWG